MYHQYVDLRAFIVLSLLLCLIAPAYNHHAAERDPWHGHLVRHGPQSLAVHQHTLEGQHAHATTRSDGLVITSGSGGALPSISVAGPASIHVGPAPILAAVLSASPANQRWALSGLSLAATDPPPRPVL